MTGRKIPWIKNVLITKGPDKKGPGANCAAQKCPAAKRPACKMFGMQKDPDTEGPVEKCPTV